MQSNFWKAIDTHRDHSTPDTNRRITYHLTVLPSPRAHLPWQNRTKGDWIRPGQTDLTSVGMPTQKQIEAGMGSLAVNLGRMRQQDRKRMVWNSGRRFFDIVDPVIVGIVNAG
jgi:hypothetical protein